MNQRSRLLSALAGLCLLFICGSFVPGYVDRIPVSDTSVADLTYIDPALTIRTTRAFPSYVTALLNQQEPDGRAEELYVGTGGSGAVYRLYGSSDGFLRGTYSIALGLGDEMEHGTCEVNRLALHDLDNDGQAELVGETSQIVPRGRPRIYVWSHAPTVTMRAFVRPEIESSWGHGLGFVRNSGDQQDSIISTYCGYGEVVEYRLNRSVQPGGYVQEGLAWRVIGRLPASGEGADVTDVDNDGHPDLCLATGYSATRAAILVYSIGEESLAKEPKIVIDEDHRYGTVRFLAGPMVPDGSRELFAWWCTGLGEGQTEVVRYRLDNGRMISRESIAWSEDATMWPIDGQMAIADLNADGNGEVWFASSCGNVYRYAPAEQSNITLACSIAGGIGPITSGGIKGRPCIYLSSGNRLLQLSPSGQAH